MLEWHITQQFREDYIDQNLHDIKKQIAQGQGHHVDSLAFISGCKGIDRAQWSSSLQSQTAELYSVKSGKAFSQQLDSMIQSKTGLNSKCKMPQS